MRHDTLLVAIEAALRTPTLCPCGETMDIAARDGSLWLECRSFGAPSRLPARFVDTFRSLVHARSYVCPDAPDEAEPETVVSPARVPVARPAVARA